MTRRRSVVAVCGGLAIAAGAAAARAPPAPTAPRRPEGDLSYDVRDARSGDPIPCKLTFVGTAGTPAPAFTHADIGRPEGPGVIAAYDRVMSLTGTGTVRVPLGSYDVYVSHGPEWDIGVTRSLEVTAAGASLSARLSHVVDTRGWLSADFHVHAAPSPDSVVPLQHRVIEFASDAVEMIVSTDHNVISDYAPSIRELGAQELLASAMGDELTTNGWGHFGAFPLSRLLERAGHGAVPIHGRTAEAIFGGVRTESPGAVIDVHHPRLDAEVGYFTIGHLDPHSDRAERRGFSFDFDAVEVLNGYQDPVRRSVDRTIDDWFGLLNHGHIVTATGNSDTHHLTYNIGGYPRNYVRVRDDRPSRTDAREVSDAVKAHHAFLTTAPFVRLRSGEHGIGDLARAPGGQAALEIEVDAAPWVSVDRIILYVDGREHRRWKVAPATTVSRFRERVELKLAQDGYAAVRVDGDKIMAPVVGDNRTFGVRPLALTNPVFFDVNGNGRYDPAYGHGKH